MHCKKVILSFMFCSILTIHVFSVTPEVYEVAGRNYLFNGTLSGIQQANQIFEDGLNDTSCINCPTDRELLFFHALSRICMWAVRDDGIPVDSALELIQEAGAEVLGDRVRDIFIIEPELEENRYGQPILTPDLEELIMGLLNHLGGDGIDEVQSVIDELEMIYDSPEDRFRVFITPTEISGFLSPGDTPFTYSVEVDYSEVLMLKGLLYMAKAMLTAQTAYDIYPDIQPDDYVMEKLYENNFSVRNDLLLPNPDFLKTLPTANDPNDGAGILAQCRIDLISALQYYLDTLVYLQNEDVPAGTDPQDDELFSLDPEDENTSELINDQIRILMASIENDSVASLEKSTRQYYIRRSDARSLGMLELNYGILGKTQDSYLKVQIDSETQVTFAKNDFSIHSGQLEIQLTDDRNRNYGYFTCSINDDNLVSITDGYFTCWGNVNATIANINGFLYQETQHTQDIDLNPVFGGTGRYPDPISPREILCEFDEWNIPIVGTLPDNTLGGILPDASEQDWIAFMNPQRVTGFLIGRKSIRGKEPVPLLTSGWRIS